MLKSLSTIFFIIALTTTVYAGAKVRLDKPDQVSAGTGTYEISSVELQWDNAYISVGLRGENNTTAMRALTGDVAIAFLADLDVANVPIKNLRKWVLQWLVSNGHLVGTVAD